MLVTAETWERLLLTRISTFRGLLFSLCFSQISHGFSFHTPSLFPTPNPERWFCFFAGQTRSSRAVPTASHNRECVDCSDSLFNLIEPGLLFLILGPNCPYGRFSETQHFPVLSPSLESCWSHLNYHWAPGTDCFLGNSMKIGTQMNCEVHILALE